MHLTRQSRQLVSVFCSESVFHHLIIEFTCSQQELEKNIEDTAAFYRKTDKETNWQRKFMDKNELYTSKFEICSPSEGPLICVKNSENPNYHSVTAKGVRGALPTSILGVLASPVIRQQVFYLSRVSSNCHFKNLENSNLPV